MSKAKAMGRNWGDDDEEEESEVIIKYKTLNHHSFPASTNFS